MDAKRIPTHNSTPSSLLLLLLPSLSEHGGGFSDAHASGLSYLENYHMEIYTVANP